MQHNRDSSAQTTRPVSAYTSRVTSPIPQPPPPPPPQRHSQGTQYTQPFHVRALRNGLRIGVPLAIGYLASTYGKPIYNTVKDIANYGKHMAINALTAIRDTPYKDTEQSPPMNGIPKPSQTALPKPTQDPQHPRTS